jgi:hypothetical protein
MTATVDLTPIAVAFSGSLFSVVAAVLTYLINTRLKSTQNAKVLADAVRNSIGFAEAASVDVINQAHYRVEVPGLSPKAQTRLQYVLDHAGEEAASFGITQQAIADKITAQIGNRKLDVLASPVGTIVVAPSAVEAPQPISPRSS